MHLHKVRLDEKSRFAAAGTTNDQHVFVSGIGRVLWSAGHHKPFGLRKNDVILRLWVHKGGNISFGAPAGASVFHIFSVLFGVLAFLDLGKLFADAERFSGRKLHVKATEGYDAETIPPAIKAAILLILGTLYDNESDNIVGRSVSELSLTAEKLLAPWRVTPYRDDRV